MIKALPVLVVLALMLLLAFPALAHETGDDHAHTPLVLNVLMRWMHILAAIGLVGGSFFLRFVLVPAAGSVLDPDTHANLREQVRKRWSMVVNIGMLMFIVSGFYNYLMVTRFEHPDEPTYHMLFGIKFLLAMVVFFLAALLTSRKQRLAAKSPMWMGVMLTVALTVILIAGYMKMM